MEKSGLTFTSLAGIGLLGACSTLFIGCAGNSPKPQHMAELSDRTQTSEAITVPQMETKPVVETDNRQIVVSMDDSSEQMQRYPDVDLEPVSKPEITSFQFGFDKSELSDEDKQVLRQHARFLVDHPQIRVRVTGHTDHHGPKAYNEYLSKKRAEAVTAVLLEAGVMESQIEIAAMANKKPLAEAKHARDNRRVELDFEELNLVSK